VSTNRSFDQHGLERYTRRLTPLWGWLVEPAAAIEDGAQRRKARLLSSLVLIIIALFVLYHTMSLIVFPERGISLPIVGGYVLLGSAYTLSRTKHYRLGAVLLALSFSLVSFVQILGNTHSNPSLVLTFSIPGVLLGSIFCSVRGTVILALANLVGIMSMPVLAPATLPDFELVFSPLGVNVMTYVLVVIAMRHRDQTEKDRKAELRESEARYHSLFENSPISLWEEDASQIKKYIDGLQESGVSDLRAYFAEHPDAVVDCARMMKVLDINRATLDLFKAHDKAQLSEGLGAVFSDESLDVFREELIALATGSTEFEGEVVLKTIAGDEIHAVVRLAVASGYEHTWSKVFVSVIDISERVRVEQALKSAEREKEAILDGQLEHVIYQDREHRILWPNQAACESVAVTREELIGRYCYTVWPERDTRCEDCPVALAMETGRRQEVRKSTPDGRYWFIRGYPVRAASGVVVGGIEVTQEVTEQVRAQEEIRRFSAELERRVEARTRELWAVNKELETFAYSVSHDLRAPLRSIDGFSQALLEDYGGQLDAAGRGYLQRVRAASQRMGQLIDDLLKLSRLTRSEMRREQVDLSALAREIAAEVQATQPGRAVEFVIRPGVVVDGDPRLLRVMLENLLDNAWKFTSKHERSRIELGVIQDEGQTVYFVRDDGAGFDMTYADKLFGAFQRLHAVTEFEGNGIGLATVQRIIHRHGGRVWAEGAVERGATFFFTL